MGQSEPHALRFWRGACLAVALWAPAHAGAQAILPADPLAASCRVSDDRSQDPRQQRQSPEQKPAQPTPAPATAPEAGELLHPPREREIQDLGGVLKALADPEKSGPALAGLAEGRPFSLQRLAVLLGDARSIVAGLHARALRQRLAQTKGLETEIRQWIEASAGLIEGCGGSRFANRGGPAVYEQAVALVAKHRSAIEGYLFQAAPAQPAAPSAPAAPSPTPRKSSKRGS